MTHTTTVSARSFQGEIELHMRQHEFLKAFEEGKGVFKITGGGDTMIVTLYDNVDDIPEGHAALMFNNNNRVLLIGRRKNKEEMKRPSMMELVFSAGQGTYFHWALPNVKSEDEIIIEQISTDPAILNTTLAA